MKKHGFFQSKEDSCLFLRIRGTEKTFLVIYVDDGITDSNQQSLIDEFQIRFHPVERFEGINVKQNSFCHLASSVRGLRDGERGLLFSLTSVEVKAAITKSATEL